MSQPRQILPGTTYLVSRRCLEQRFFLAPSGHVNALFAYCLGYAAQKFDIELHGFTVMSNHWHGVLTDRRGQLPLFMAWVHTYVAKCINQRLRRRENLWSCEPYSAQALEGMQEVMDKLIYCLGNPVKAHLVERAEQWPGLTSMGLSFEGESLLCKRPEGFFRPSRRTGGKGLMPEHVSIQLSIPKAFEGSGIAGFSEALEQGLERYERGCGQERRGKVLGIRRIEKLTSEDTPKSLQKRFARHLSVSGKTGKVLGRALARLKAFREAYREAFARYRVGKHTTVFPAGTYKLRLEASVSCVPI